MTPTFVNGARDVNTVKNKQYQFAKDFRKMNIRLDKMDTKLDKAMNLLTGNTGRKKKKNQFTVQTARAPMPTQEQMADKEDHDAEAADELIAGEVVRSMYFRNIES